MALSIDQLTAQALKLPPDSRARLAEQLVESLADADPGEIQKLRTAEAIRHRDGVISGLVRPIPGEQVLTEVRRVVGR